VASPLHQTVDIHFDAFSGCANDPNKAAQALLQNGLEIVESQALDIEAVICTTVLSTWTRMRFSLSGDLSLLKCGAGNGQA
jgi:hypothetical protein